MTTDTDIEYLVFCPNCTGEHDAAQAVWCSCDPQNPSKLCPFCLTCFCGATESFKETFWQDAPAPVLEGMLLGDMLVRSGVITTDQLLQGLKMQKLQDLKLGEALVVLGFLTKERIDEFLSAQHSVVTFDISKVLLDVGLVRQVGVDFCRQKRFLPLEKEPFQNRTLLTVAMADPSDADTINRVQRMTDCQIVAGSAPEQQILDALQATFPEGAASGPAGPPTRAAATPLDSASTDRVVDRLLRIGIERGAHEIELARDGSAIRAQYRIGQRSYGAKCPPGTDPVQLLGAVRQLAGIELSGSGQIRYEFEAGEVILAVESLHEADTDRIIIRFAV